MTDTNILVLVGSLRAASNNRQLAEAAVALAPEGTAVSMFDGLGALPVYNEDIEETGSTPEPVQALRDAIIGADAVLVVTPEHNGTIPAALKNAIDWASRPRGASSFLGKPVAVIGGALGQFGGVWAQDEARKSLGIAGATLRSDISLTVPNVGGRFAQTHPKDDAEIAAQLVEVLTSLAHMGSAQRATV